MARHGGGLKIERQVTHATTPSSRHHEDGVKVDRVAIDSRAGTSSAGRLDYFVLHRHGPSGRPPEVRARCATMETRHRATGMGCFAHVSLLSKRVEARVTIQTG
jgi:hypothetical protein